jgi:hypothetical protein
MPLSALAIRLACGAAALVGVGAAALLAAAAVVPLRYDPAAAPAAAQTAPVPEAALLTTADYLEMPEIFQITLVSGSVAMLLHLGHASGREGDCECFTRWSVSEDVVSLVSLHVQRNPQALAAPFADTLLETLAERCAAPD